MDTFDRAIIRKVLLGKASQEEIEAFNQWYKRQSESQVDLRLLLGESGGNLEQKLWGKIKTKTQIKKTPSGRRFPIQLITRYAAAFLFFLLSIGGIFSLILSHKDQMEVTQTWKAFENTKGMIKTIQLPDGSKVQLFHDSKIWVATDFTRNRSIKLQGEAFFEVERDSLNPFRVYTHSITTKVLGTSFLIQARDSISESVQVRTGKVSVSLEGKFHQELEPGNRLEWTDSTLKVDENGDSRAFDWVDGVLRFEHETLAEMVSKLENWYGVTISLEKNPSASCQLTGTYQNLSLEEILKLISFSIPLDYSIQENHVQIHIQSCQH